MRSCIKETLVDKISYFAGVNEWRVPLTPMYTDLVSIRLGFFGGIRSMLEAQLRDNISEEIDTRPEFI